MKKQVKYIFGMVLGLFFIACSSDDDSTDIDETKPEITINYDGGFPQACDELIKGDTYQFKARTTDNVALASYSIGIHHNFDHHAHDNQTLECELDAIKEAVTPFLFIKTDSIPNGETTYEINEAIIIPENIDVGDYHCTFSVTDVTGWQSRTSVDIKIVE